MVTVNGQIVNSQGVNVATFVDFKPQSTPQFIGGVIVESDTITVQTDPTDGTFSVNLEPGYYQVTIRGLNTPTQFQIAVVDGTSPVNIDDIVSSNVSPLPGVPGNTVFNGLLPGNLTFVPVANPGDPTTAPVTVAGGNQTGTDLFAYRIAWQTAVGVTMASPDDVTNTPPTSPNNATRVTFPTPPTGVTAVLIYRSTNDSTTNRYLLASVAPSAGHYDDFESTANFNARINTSLTAPTTNTTSGGLVPQPGDQPVAIATHQGLQLQALVFMLGTNMRIKPGFGIQIYNGDTGLWHTLLSFGNPAQLGLDAGSS